MLGIAINARGCRAASYTGSQAGIITDTAHGQAKIIEIRPKRILEALEAGNVVIIAGFQGLSSAYEITTLGRGGSDLTAVAMAAAVGAEVCEIYTDVGGVMTADPRVVPDARADRADRLRRHARARRGGGQGAPVALRGAREAERPPAARPVLFRRRGARHLGAGG